MKNEADESSSLKKNAEEFEDDVLKKTLETENS